ncbi:protein phosphatase 1 regulatory subunit 12C isoform X1 [Ictalurus punctatus]|uniref:Protein phosphatase 1 regulatory subunit n=1 Tax=Ictalurus punctatus TaxID=7998 RepID=A0A2D0S4G7_ICTPU|nr:protein phosphatase 1 regulatory subunit 12C isoform X1 [Ictalurus punctatus]XP_053540133.1 protein phosphatase 1 regulatory subunit 12C isoform X1 [Ictalurus punctatus]
MGDAAKVQRREQIKRWNGSSTDKQPAAPRRRWRDEEEDGREDGERAQDSDVHRPGRQHVKRRRRVRFERTAEFLAICASGDLEEAKEMLKEVQVISDGDKPSRQDVVNCSNADGITALHQACIDGSIEVVAFLLSQGANVNQVDNEGWTPLHVAASCGNIEIAEYLLKEGASLSLVNCDGDVPLDIAEDEPMEALLQEHTLKQALCVKCPGVDVEEAKRLEEELIMRDARRWLAEGVPSDLHHPRTKATPLHVAAAKGYLEAIKLLCQCGLDVSAKDGDGWTPLHAAAHWGQSEACCLLAEQLCDMEARSNGGQTPFDVADESVETLLEELLQRQASWRTEQDIKDKQNAQASANGSTAKKRRSSVCRMSSREKMSVQDQSKERGVSGGLLNEERESSPETSTQPSPDTGSITTSTVSPADKTPEEKEAEEREQERESRTARVPPTLQRCDSATESPSSPSTDGKKYQAPVRDEESESQRKARSRLMRQSRRSTQGVTLTDLKEAERTVNRASEPQPSLQTVSPVVTVTPAERDTEPVKASSPEGDSKLGVRDRRKARRERRSTGIATSIGETEDLDANEPTQADSTSSDTQPVKLSLSLDFRKLYVEMLKENGALREKLQETQLKLSECKVELERLRQSQENGCDRPALLELERFEKKALERKAAELEDELKVLVDLRADNQRLKDENAALIRVISKLSR